MRRLLLALPLLLLFCYRVDAQVPTSLGWYQIPNTTWQPLCPSPSPGGTSCSAVTAAWSSGVADTKRNRLLFWGGGHADYGGNEVYALNLTTLTMTRLSQPSPATLGVETNADGTAATRHTYGGLTYIPAVNGRAHDFFYSFGGFTFGSGGCGPASTATWLLNLDTLATSGPSNTSAGAWTRQDPVNGTAITNDCVDYQSAEDYDPNSDAVYGIAGPYYFFKWVPNTNTMTQLQFVSGIASHVNAVVDYGHKLFMIIGNGSIYSSDITQPSPTMTNLASTISSTCSALVNADYPGLAFDPAQNAIIGWVGGNSVIILDPIKQTCTTQTFPNGPSASFFPGATGGGETQQGIFGHFRYFPSLGIFAVVGDWGQNAFALRLDPVNGSNNPAALTDFQARCAAPGVIVCQGFDNDSQFVPMTGVSPGGTGEGANGAGGYGTITRDPNITASGSGALRYEWDPFTGANGPGYYRVMFSNLTNSPPGSVPANISCFGPTAGCLPTFYLQYRFRITPEMVNQNWGDTSGNTSWKFSIFHWSSVTCGSVELTATNRGTTGNPIMYTDCGGTGLWTNLWPAPLNITGTTPLLLSQGDTATTGYNCQYGTVLPNPNCFQFPVNTWMTFYWKVTPIPGGFGTPTTAVQAWVSNGPGQPMKEWINVSNLVTNQNNTLNQDFNAVELLNYMTGKNSTLNHPIAYTWYDEVIVSTQPIAAPGSVPASGTYYAQAPVGAGNGVDCADAKALPIIAGDWAPGNTIHLCGVINFPVGSTGIPIVGRNGTSSAPITILAEPGAILQSPRFSGALDGPALGTGPAAEGGAIDISATSSFIIVDGGTNGIIQNTANGTGLANSADSLGIWAGGDNIIVRNWTVKNIYNRTRGTTTGAGGSSGDIMVTGGATSIKVCNNTFNNASIGAELNFHTTPMTPGIASWTNPASCQSNTFTPGAVFANNTLDDHNWMSHVNGSGAPVIINNQFGSVGWSNWNGDTADFHQDGFFTVGNSAATFKPYFINNYMPGDQNQGSPSGMILYTDDGHASSGQGQSSVMVGNILYGTGGGISCCMGIGIQAVVTGNPKGPYQWYNNTFVNFGNSIEDFAWQIASPTVDLRNNLFDIPVVTLSGWFFNNQNTGWSFSTLTVNGNSYFGGRAPGSPSGPFGIWTSNVDYPHWLTNCVSGGGGLCDTNSANTDPLLAGESNFPTGGTLTPSGFVPSSNSPAANLGDNLSTQCASIPNQCASMPQTVGAGGSCGNGCIARPAAGRWTAGAFQLTSGSVAPNPPTGLAATVSASTVSLSWTASTGTPAPTAYTMYRGTVHGGPYTAITSGLTTTSTTDTPANGTYFYVIAAYIGGIVSSISGNGTTATVTCTAACAFPTGSVFTIGGDSQAAFNGTFTSTGQPTSSTFTFASSTNASGTGGGAWQSGAESAKSNEVTVTTPATLTASFLHASLVFSNQTVGTSSASQVNPFTNTSAPGGTITISGKSITGANAADFSFTDNCPSLLLSSVSCNFNVTFTPTAPGTRVANLNVFDNASGSPQTSALSGTGVAQTPIVTLNPTSLNFGDQTLSTTSSVRSIILTNTGSGTLNITSVVASGDFAVVTVPVTNCGGTLAPLGTCSLNVTFTPTATGGRVGAVTVTDNAAGSPHVANLSGNGITTKCAMSGNVTLSGAGSVCQ